MSSSLKTMLALGKFKDQHAKNAWKRAMIDAELEATKKPKLSKEDKE